MLDVVADIEIDSASNDTASEWRDLHHMLADAAGLQLHVQVLHADAPVVS